MEAHALAEHRAQVFQKYIPGYSKTLLRLCTRGQQRLITQKKSGGNFKIQVHLWNHYDGFCKIHDHLWNVTTSLTIKDISTCCGTNTSRFRSTTNSCCCRSRCASTQSMKCDYQSHRQMLMKMNWANITPKRVREDRLGYHNGIFHSLDSAGIRQFFPSPSLQNAE